MIDLKVIRNTYLVIECTYNHENQLPIPNHRIDYQDGMIRLEYDRNTINLIALQLCGIKLRDTDSNDFYG